MKNMMFFVLAITVFFLVGCGSKKAVSTKPETASVQMSEPIVVKPSDPDPFCAEPRGNTPRAILRSMDYDLDRTASGKSPCGSFTDFFVVNASDALKAGAKKEDVDARVERAIALAKKGLFISSYERELFQQGGAKAIRQYVNDWLRDAMKSS